MFSVNEIWNIFDRSRSVKCVHCNQIRKISRFEFPHVLLHSRTFILEYSDGSPLFEKLIGFGIGEWNFVDIDLNTMFLLNEANGVFNDGQSP
ncbi:hypothetical protein SDC9_195044 [bioreactor metagenome]|uniref:Uncharacterized protein n=1 Tax=bioreactor metagenome TaxID=1076179 RepID=A0A645I9F8_9ZZZZ